MKLLIYSALINFIYNSNVEKSSGTEMHVIIPGGLLKMDDENQKIIITVKIICEKENKKELNENIYVPVPNYLPMRNCQCVPPNPPPRNDEGKLNITISRSLSEGNSSELRSYNTSRSNNSAEILKDKKTKTFRKMVGNFSKKKTSENNKGESI